MCKTMTSCFASIERARKRNQKEKSDGISNGSIITKAKTIGINHNILRHNAKKKRQRQCIIPHNLVKREMSVWRKKERKKESERTKSENL